MTDDETNTEMYGEHGTFVVTHLLFHSKERKHV